MWTTTPAFPRPIHSLTVGGIYVGRVTEIACEFSFSSTTGAYGVCPTVEAAKERIERCVAIVERDYAQIA